MSRLALAAPAVATLSACLTPPGPFDSRCVSRDCPPASRAFDGEWQGDVTVTLNGAESFTYPVAMYASVEGYDLTVHGLCPDGSGSFSAFATGDTAVWDEAAEIQCSVMTDCPGGVLRFTSARMSASETRLRMGLDAECGGAPASAALASVRVEGVSHH